MNKVDINKSMTFWNKFRKMLLYVKHAKNSQENLTTEESLPIFLCVLQIECHYSV